MRFLGIDYGKVRIGLALSDPSLTIVSPAGYIINKGEKKNLAFFRDFIEKNKVSKIVLGLPLNADGSIGFMAVETQKFGVWLGKQFDIEIIYHDERYTSLDAETELREKMHIKDPKKIAEMVDSIAACMILNSWLEKLRKK